MTSSSYRDAAVFCSAAASAFDVVQAGLQTLDRHGANGFFLGGASWTFGETGTKGLRVSAITAQHCAIAIVLSQARQIGEPSTHHGGRLEPCSASPFCGPAPTATASAIHSKGILGFVHRTPLRTCIVGGGER